MSLKLGSTSIGSLYLGSTKVSEAYLGSVKVYASAAPVDPYNPLGLPPYTIRLKFTDGVTPSFAKGTAVQVTSSPNVWDLTYENADWSNLLSNRQYSLTEVLGANTSSVTKMSYMFYSCTSLTSVPLYDTSSATNMGSMFAGCTSLTSVPLYNTSSATNINGMFSGCTSLTSVPLFNTSSVTNLGYMFYNCTSLTSVPLYDTSSVTRMNNMLYNCLAVESGALALYQQASTQANPPTSHTDTFKYCGSNTVTGAAELAQIPTDWGGTNSGGM